MLLFSDCTDKEHISGKCISFLMVLDLLSCYETVVKILYPWIFKLAVLYILLCDIRTKAFINLIAKRKKKKGTGEKGHWQVVIYLFSSAQFNRGSCLSLFCLPACVFLLWSICFLFYFSKRILSSFKYHVLFFWWVEKLGCCWNTKWCPCTVVTSKYAGTAAANSMFTTGQPVYTVVKWNLWFP